MALTIPTQDLVNYPGNSKNVALDVTRVIPAGYEGDEKIVLEVSTTAYSDISLRTAIQDLYVTDLKAGWCKSSGLVGSGGKYNLSASAYKLKVKMDATVSGSDGSGYYTISLDYNADSTPIAGETIADDMEDKIRAISCATADSGFQLSYTNASVEYRNGKFWVVSGSIGSYYTGANRSSVDIQPAASLDASAVLGFNLPIDSETLAGIAVNEAALTSSYTLDTTPMAIGAGTGVTVGDCLMITDNTNTDYFTALSGTTDTSVVVPTFAINGYVGVTNSYSSTNTATKIQILREQDPDNQPTAWYTDIDAVMRFGIKTMINQIDYSS